MAEREIAHPWFAAVFDWLNAPAERGFMREVREELVGGVRGRILEIGCGAGASFPYYGAGASKVVATEPDIHMLERARKRAAELGRANPAAWQVRELIGGLGLSTALAGPRDRRRPEPASRSAAELVPCRGERAGCRVLLTMRTRLQGTVLVVVATVTIQVGYAAPARAARATRAVACCAVHCSHTQSMRDAVRCCDGVELGDELAAQSVPTQAQPCPAGRLLPLTSTSNLGGPVVTRRVSTVLHPPRAAPIFLLTRSLRL